MSLKLPLVSFMLLTNVSCLLAQTAIHDPTITGPATDPHSSAVLDVKSTDKGVLVPNVDIADLATADPVTGPANGLLVYNTNTTTGVGYYYWNVSSWVRLMSGNTTPLSGTGAANKVAYWTGASTLAQNTNFHWDNSNLRLGIGTSAPGNGIHVRNADPTPLFLERTSAANVNIRFTNTSGTLYAGMNPSQGFAIGPNQDLGNAATWMTLTTAGNLGIGTTTPTQSRLVVNGSISIPRAESFQFLESISGAFRAGINSTNSDEPGLGFNAMRFYVNANSTTPVVVIGGGTNTGNLGVGVTAPLQRIHANGDINVNTGQGFRINNTAATGQYLRGDGTRFTSSAIQPQDLPGGSNGYILNQTTQQPTSDFNISGAGVIGTSLNVGGRIFMNTISGQASAARGISWYTPAFVTWFDYMAPAGATNAPSGTAAPSDAPAGVTSWARRFNIENIGSYGWLFESGTNVAGNAPTVKFAINASTGTFHSTGDGIVDGVVYAGASARMGTNIAGGYYQDNTNGAYRSIVSAATTNGYYFQTNSGAATTMYVGLGGTYNGNVGIGTTTPTYKLHVIGRIKTNAIDETSDARLKTEVTDLSDALAKVLAMRGVNYKWRKDEYPHMEFDSTLQFGLIAQELEKIVPELVHTDSEGWKSIEYSHIVPLLIEAIKEQQKLLDDERQGNHMLKASLDRLEERVKLLEASGRVSRELGINER